MQFQPRIYLLIFCMISGCLAQNYRLRITDTYFERCPHINTDGIFGEKEDTHVNFKQTYQNYGAAEITRLQVTGTEGEHLLGISLPGCFNVKLTTQFTKDIDNPYVEAFINVGGEKPCNEFENNPYCLQSEHPALRLVTSLQKTCKFCDMCIAADRLAKEHKDAGFNSRISQQQICPGSAGRRIRANQKYPLELNRICTPSKEEFEQEMDKRFGPDWRQFKEYIKRGNVLMTVHILDRRNPTPTPCLQLGAKTFQWHGPPIFWESILGKLRRSCEPYLSGSSAPANKPQDEYLACYYGHVNYVLDEQEVP